MTVEIRVYLADTSDIDSLGTWLATSRMSVRSRYPAVGRGEQGTHGLSDRAVRPVSTSDVALLDVVTWIESKVSRACQDDESRPPLPHSTVRKSMRRPALPRPTAGYRLRLTSGTSPSHVPRESMSLVSAR